MIKLLGISAGLIGTTVLGGMGLAYAHDMIYVEATPVRADVVQPAPVLSRAAPVLTRAAPVLRKTPESVFEVSTVDVARLSNGTTQNKSDAVVGLPPDTSSGLENTPASTFDVDLGPAPIVSARPKMRVRVKTSRTAAVAAPKIRKPKQQLRPQVTRAVSTETIQRAVPKRAPRFVIGVYR